MKVRRGSAKFFFPVVDLEAGMPTVHDALSHLDRELAAARRAGCRIIKLIHGYGSSGAGGDIRIAVQLRLVEMARDGKIGGCIFGENSSRNPTRADVEADPVPSRTQARCGFGTKESGHHDCCALAEIRETQPLPPRTKCTTL